MRGFHGVVSGEVKKAGQRSQSVTDAHVCHLDFKDHSFRQALEPVFRDFESDGLGTKCFGVEQGAFKNCAHNPKSKPTNSAAVSPIALPSRSPSRDIFSIGWLGTNRRLARVYRVERTAVQG